MTQLWVALCAYLLTSYIRFTQRVNYGAYELFRRLQVTALEYLPLADVLSAKSAPGQNQSGHLPELWHPKTKALFSTN